MGDVCRRIGGRGVWAVPCAVASDDSGRIERLEALGRELLAARVCRTLAPIAAEVWQTIERAPFEVAREQSYERVELGWEWGPAFSTAWFRLRGRVPDAPAGLETVLRFSTSTEGLLWWRGEPVQGFDPGRDRWHVPGSLTAGSDVELSVEAACNHLWGEQAFSWDDEATHARWGSERPGRFERCEWAAFDRRVFEAWVAWEFALGVAREAGEGSAEGTALVRRLEALSREIDPEEVGGSVASLDIARALGDGAATGPRGVVLGHAHIDTAWLWPVEETYRKCARSWSNVLRLMERDAEFVFVASQPQQYRWVEERYPRVFEQIRARVAEGRWEPEGGMWVEADCNCPSGESLVRQILHGTRWFENRFGARGGQRVLFLPDTFGFPACLPQLMVRSGLELFVTNKLHWNDTTEFPRTTFRWRGLDGTGVLAHLTPGRDYNSELTPKELARAKRTNREGLEWVQHFGIGDGGGGPKAEHLERARLAGGFGSMAPLEFGTMRGFLDRLREGLDPGSLAVWEGELYLEKHRGTYTTHGRIKGANLECEELLRAAEALSVLDPGGDEASRAEAHERLDEAWKLVLLNQFHDILPGSSIGAVYEDAERDYARARAIGQEVVEGVLGGASSGGAESLVFNPCSVARDGVVEVGGELRHVEGVRCLGVRTASRQSGGAGSVTVDGHRMSNEHLRCEVDDVGRVNLGTRNDDLQVFPGLNQLALYEDRPPEWDAWDIAPGYEVGARPVEGTPESVEVVLADSLRGEIEVTRSIGRRSRVWQRYRLDAGSSRLDVLTRVDWREDHTLLRALFETGIESSECACGTQFGHVSRSTRRETDFERARFEFPAHRWVDLSAPGRGLAVLARAKYGFSCHAGVIGVSLLRSPTHPDPGADRGEHEFVYSLMPHAGDWRAAGVDVEAEALTRPLMVAPGGSGALLDSWAPLGVDTQGAAHIEVACCKRAEGSDDVILRLVETRGGSGRVAVAWPSDIESVERVDLLERRLDGAARDSIEVRPFEIVTLCARRGG